MLAGRVDVARATSLRECANPGLRAKIQQLTEATRYNTTVSQPPNAQKEEQSRNRSPCTALSRSAGLCFSFRRPLIIQRKNSKERQSLRCPPQPNPRKEPAATQPAQRIGRATAFPMFQIRSDIVVTFRSVSAPSERRAFIGGSDARALWRAPARCSRRNSCCPGRSRRRRRSSATRGVISVF
jgi:hypothetical protein